MTEWVRRSLRPLIALVALLGLAVTLAHAALIGAGQWQADEYLNFGLLRDHGLDQVIQRVATWSPRPLSEAVLALYGLCVLALHRPLIAPMLAGCWLALFAAIALAVRPARGTAARLAVACVVFALFLLGPSISEAFYWPMAAAPYLLCLAGVSMTVIGLVDDPAGAHGRRVALLGMVIAATSAEVGIFFVLCLGPLLAAQSLAARPRGEPRHALAWLLPVLIALPLVIAVVHGPRVSGPRDGWTLGHAHYHLLGVALRDGIAGLPGELAGDGSAARLLLLLAVAGGAYLLLGGPQTRAPAATRLLALGASLLGGIVLSRIAADYVFGIACCERHETMRQCFVLLLALVAGACAASLRPAPVRLAPVGALLVGAALLAGAVPRVPAVRHDLALVAEVRRVTRANWTSGLATDTPVMTLRDTPQGDVVHTGLPITPGRYDAGPAQQWFITGVLDFFGKRAAIVPDQSGAPTATPR